MAKVEFTAAPQVEQVADDLIAAHHPHLSGVRIDYVFRSAAKKRGSATVLGTARKVSGLASFIAREDRDEDAYGDFFVIEIAMDVWMLMDDAEKRALVDHELSHCWVEDGELCTRGHDIEEFKSIVERHGLWKADVKAFVNAAQGSLLEPV